MPRLGSVLIFSSLALLVLTRLWVPPPGIDVLWQIKAGEWMWQTQRILTTDPFSYTRLGAPWLNHEWGSELLYYALYHAYSGLGLTWLRIGIGLSIAWCVYQTCGRFSPHRWLNMLVTLLTLLVVTSRLTNRPAVFSTLFLCIVVWLVTRVRHDPALRRHYFWLFPLFLLWTNLHAGVVLGLAALFLFWCPPIVRRLRHLSPPCPWYQREECLFVGLIGICLVNPFGYRILTFPFENLGLTVAIAHTTEWFPAYHPLALRAPGGQFVPYLFGVVLLALIVNACAVDGAYLLLLALTGVMAIKAIRFLPECACLAGPFVAAAFAPVIARHSRLTPALILASVVVAGWPLRRVSVRDLFSLTAARQPSIALSHAPDLAAFLNALQIRGKVFNDMNLGASLIFYRGPEEKVFFDGRHDIYDNAFFAEYLAAFTDPAWFEALSARYGGFDYIVLGQKDWRRHAPLHRWLWGHPDWEMVYAAAQGYVYLRKAPPFAETIRQYRITIPPPVLKARIPLLPPKGY